MIDYSEALLHAKTHLKDAEDALRKKDNEAAYAAVIDAEAELHRLKNWIWRNMRG